jgi:hypothetical protein
MIWMMSSPFHFQKVCWGATSKYIVLIVLIFSLVAVTFCRKTQVMQNSTYNAILVTLFARHFCTTTIVTQNRPFWCLYLLDVSILQHI